MMASTTVDLDAEAALLYQTRDLTINPDGGAAQLMANTDATSTGGSASPTSVVVPPQQSVVATRTPRGDDYMQQVWGQRRGERNAEQNIFLLDLPNEVLIHILYFLDVSDLLSASRTSHHLRTLSLTPVLHAQRLRSYHHILPPLLFSPRRPTVPNLVSRQIMLTPTSIISRKLARSLVSIRLSRRLAARPSPETLVERAVLPAECVPRKGSGGLYVAPALIAKRREVERERVKDCLRRWVGSVMTGEVGKRAEGVRRKDELFGRGRVWRLRRFWEGVCRGEAISGR